ncbi:hypothetical protein LIA77_01621 [Sarocladium implicatum]|nr:hypothetical protein LIA77_01621 [Sarocladium implicatum]
MDIHAPTPPNAGLPSPRLPLELIIQIIEAVPPNREVILPPSSVVTKTLLSLTRVSRATYRPATMVLRQQCVYINSSIRLSSLLICMKRFVPSLETPMKLQHITSLYLAPFGPTLDDEPTANGVCELLGEVSTTLRRLVISMPFSTLSVWNDHLNLRGILREGLSQLTNLEEFACIGDYPLLTGPDESTDIWRLWPQLTKVMLFGVPLESHWLWWDIATLEHLRHVVLVRPKQTEPRVNVKARYFRTLPAGDERLQRKVKLVLMHRVRGDDDDDDSYNDLIEDTSAWGLPRGHPDYLELDKSNWDEIDPEETMEVICYGVPRMGAMSSEELLVRLAKSWVETGTLWDARA